MKEAVSGIILFLVLAVAFSGLTGCAGTASSHDANSEPAAKPEGETKKSDYPPIASAVATAEIKNIDGTAFTVNDKKGKVLLLNLWATWCGPCRSEMPTLVKMQEQHGARGFEVIGLNTDNEDTDVINEFAGKMKLNYTLAWADTQVQASLLKISKFPGIPQSFLVDREGNLRGVFRGANPADVSKMEEVVAKLVDEQ